MKRCKPIKSYDNSMGCVSLAVSWKEKGVNQGVNQSNQQKDEIYLTKKDF